MTPVKAALVMNEGAGSAALIRALQRDGDIVVVGHAHTATAGVRLTSSEAPDIVVIDLGVDVGDGHQAIAEIMACVPTPILVLSAPTEGRTSPAVAAALVAGALDSFPSAPDSAPDWTADRAAQVRDRVRRLSSAKVIRHLRGGTSAATRDSRPGRPVGPPVVAMAASTGGPSVLATILAGLHGLEAPVLVVQHLHPDFTSGMLEWMSRAAALPVEMARDGQLDRPGVVYIAPGGRHLRLGRRLRLELTSEPLTAHRPSADVLLSSVADHAGPSAVGVLLTGMGDDGAAGLLRIRQAGGRTLAQDEASCAVFGMPRAAHRLGAVSELRPPTQLASAILQAVRAGTAARADSAPGSPS